MPPPVCRHASSRARSQPSEMLYCTTEGDGRERRKSHEAYSGPPRGESPWLGGNKRVGITARGGRGGGLELRLALPTMTIFRLGWDVSASGVAVALMGGWRPAAPVDGAGLGAGAGADGSIGRGKVKLGVCNNHLVERRRHVLIRVLARNHKLVSSVERFPAWAEVDGLLSLREWAGLNRRWPKLLFWADRGTRFRPGGGGVMYLDNMQNACASAKCDRE